MNPLCAPAPWKVKIRGKDLWTERTTQHAREAFDLARAELAAAADDPGLSFADCDCVPVVDPAFGRVA